jgi:3-oxoacyl-[acyl-carrier-protein] synthase-3
VSSSGFGAAGAGIARFAGTVSLDYGGGFASVRTPPRGWDTAGATAFLLRVRGHGTTYANRNVRYGDTLWDFDGQEIFKRAVAGMGESSVEALRRAGKSPADINLVVPHQANLRIIEFVAKRAGIGMDRVFLTVHKYGNMSAATVPVALCEALEEGRVKPGATLLMPAFGGGLTFCAHLVRWGERCTPLGESPVVLPDPDRSALEIVRGLMAAKGVHRV